MLFKWVTRGTGASYSSFAVASPSTSASSLCSFFVFVSFVTIIFDNFQFQSQIRLSQVNMVVPLRLKIKLYAVFIEWGVRINLLFVGQQDIVNYWDFPSKITRNCHKKLVPKSARYEYWKMFVKLSPRDQLICFADFLGMILLAAAFLLPLPNCFLRVCLPTLFAAVLKFLLPLTTSSISGAVYCHKSAPTRCAAGTIYLRRNENAVLPVICACASNPCPRCQSIPLRNGVSTCLEATIL